MTLKKQKKKKMKPNPKMITKPRTARMERRMIKKKRRKRKKRSCPPISNLAIWRVSGSVKVKLSKQRPSKLYTKQRKANTTIAM